MLSLEQLVPGLSPQHYEALTWFATHAGKVVTWPTPIGGQIRLVTQAKGIYKPNWTQYALSVRQTLSSVYADREPEVRGDGSWTYEYFQEGAPAERDRYFTNRALLLCVADRIPVGVMRQISDRSPVKYQVLGLAVPTEWNGGYFRFEGGRADLRNRNGADSAAPSAVLAVVEEENRAAPFEPGSILDARILAFRAIVQRRGQHAFRSQLLRAYGCTCAISGADAEAALEAAHILPYLGPETNHITNGLLLRADLHSLFDLREIAIRTRDMSLVVSPALRSTIYRDFAGTRVRVPASAEHHPSKLALDQHHAEAVMQW